MTEATATLDVATGESNQRSGQITLMLIMGIPVFIILLSTFVFYTGIGAPDDTRNQGNLISPPRQLSDYGINFETQSKDGKPLWTLLQISSGLCDGACADDLYYSRQLKTTLGRRAPGLRRVLWVPESLSLDEAIANEHPNLVVEQSPLTTQVATLFEGVEKPRYALIDARGFLMMTYTDAHDYKQIAKDLKFLLTRSGY